MFNDSSPRAGYVIGAMDDDAKPLLMSDIYKIVYDRLDYVRMTVDCVHDGVKRYNVTLSECVDLDAICQNVCCEIEKKLGIFPNVPGLKEVDKPLGPWTGGTSWPTPDVASNPGKVEADGQYVRNAYKVEDNATDAVTCCLAFADAASAALQPWVKGDTAYDAARAVLKAVEGMLRPATNEALRRARADYDEGYRDGRRVAARDRDEALRQARADVWERAARIAEYDRRSELAKKVGYIPTAQAVANDIAACLRAAAKAEEVGS